MPWVTLADLVCDSWRRGRITLDFEDRRVTCAPCAAAARAKLHLRCVARRGKRNSEHVAVARTKKCCCKLHSAGSGSHSTRNHDGGADLPSNRGSVLQPQLAACTRARLSRVFHASECCTRHVCLVRAAAAPSKIHLRRATHTGNLQS